MASSTEDKKRLALDKLRFNRNNQASREQTPATSSAASQQTLHHFLPPTQSRDGSVSSRFFPSPTPSLGNVLVPNSSPLSQHDYPVHPYRPYELLSSHNVATSSTSFSNTGWMGASLGSTLDPLSAPSGLISHVGILNASSRRRINEDNHLAFEEGPPRKKINRGLSEDSPDIVWSPPSPEIRRLGHRRHLSSIGTDTFSLSSDDSTPDIARVDAVSKSRLTKERPNLSPDTTPMSDISTDKGFISFKISHPMESPIRVQAAWNQASGDEKRANSFLLDPLWSPPSNPSPELSSRITEIDEATRAQRVAEKEKGKKSMIYANRSILDTRVPVTPTSSKVVVNIVTPTPTPVSPNSPLTPALKVAQRKRAKKMVINSDFESDADEDDDNTPINHGTAVDVYERRALEYLNTANSEALQELTGCTSDQALTIISLRPFTSGEDIKSKLGQGKKKATGISPRMFEDCAEMFKGYGSVDNVLEDCERIGSSLRTTIDSWNSSKDAEDGAVSLVSLDPSNSKKGYLKTQSSLLSDTVTLKEYQLLGVNWLNLLYNCNLSCILADEMGLGKTIQVIGFLAHLKQSGKEGPHLIVVPSSTLENWCREFSRFAPSIAFQTYYGDKNDRVELRQRLRDTQRRKENPDGWEVLITTYNLAQGDERDRHFFRKLEWDCCIYDEGHVLKNFQSQRYQSLLKFPYTWRLLLTGTPLQNNLQELVSLLNFILPDQFAESLEHLRAIFKVKGDTKVSLLSRERISRAKKMMTPFVLRRRKDQVLKDLPEKTERIEWCEMTESQRSIYHDTLQRSRKTVLNTQNDAGNNSKLRRKKANEKQQSENSTNVLMDLRKAASHPMLFRSRFTDEILTGITKQLLKEPEFKKRGARADFVMEDMSVMTDAELQTFCTSYKSTKKYLQDEVCYSESGKVQVLLRLLSRYTKEQRKILIFSQFTQILDILQIVLTLKNIRFLVLTGSTQVDVRQTLVDEFTDDESISVFLLSTKAGGMGINLTAASVVIMFDHDFNPHNDRQAQDRAYRIGQKRNVEVVKLISKGTIEEDMLQLGETKLALDEAVAGDPDKGDCAPDRRFKTSLMNSLRQQFEKDEELNRTSITVPG